jgi:hypothetical protein
MSDPFAAAFAVFGIPLAVVVAGVGFFMGWW